MNDLNTDINTDINTDEDIERSDLTSNNDYGTVMKTFNRAVDKDDVKEFINIIESDDFNKFGLQFLSCFNTACQRKKLNIIKFFLDSTYDLTKYPNNLVLHTLSQSDDNIEIIKLLLNDGRFDPNNLQTIFIFGNNVISMTPLMEACYASYIDCHGYKCSVCKIIKLYLDCQNIDVNKTDNKGNNALHIACQYNNFEAIKLLIEDGRIDVNKKNDNGKTPFDVLCDNKLDAIKYMLQHCVI